jgi:hypothetical protein
VLEKCLADNVKARIGKPDGTYELAAAGGKRAEDSQAWFIRHRAQAGD